jgi:nucleoside-diphosphate-sugar epimerase
MNSPRILVTGGAGYIGSTLTRSLLGLGYEVTVVDRYFFGTSFLPEGHAGLVQMNKDIRRLTAADFVGVDAIIDLAAISNDPAGELDPAMTWQINHAARVRCAELAKSIGVKRYILPSSSSVYGQQEGLLSETSAIAPRTAYAEANAAAEAGVVALASASFIVCAVRQATVFGISYRMRLDLVLHQMVIQGRNKGSIPVLGDGRQWRPFVHIADVCDAMHLLLQAEAADINGEIFNLGGDHLNLTVAELATHVGTAIGVHDTHNYGSKDDRSHRMDFRKIRERLGYVPTRTIDGGACEIAAGLDDGLIDVNDPRSMTVSWYRHLLASNHNNPAMIPE